jgi:hypothetical protein
MVQKDACSPNNADCPCGEGANPRHVLVCTEAKGTSSAGRPDPYHAPTPVQVAAAEFERELALDEIGVPLALRPAAAPLGRSPDTLPEPEPGYPLDEAKSLLRKRFWPDCDACEAREQKVRSAGRNVKKFMRELCRDYPSMYLQDVQLFKAELEPLVAELELARKQRDRHQRDRGHQP